MTEYDLGKVVGDDGEAGNGIASITKTGTSGLVDTYTITYDDGTTTTFTVTNGSNASVTIQTSWGSTTSDSKVPSEKLTKDTLDTKITKSSTTGLMKNDGTVMTSGTGSGNYSAGNHTHSGYISTSSTSGLIKNDGSIMTGGTGSSNWAIGNHTHSGYVSGSKVTSWSSTVSDSNIPSEKLVKDSLDNKASSTHTHGNLTNDGKVGSNANYFVVTGTSGAITSQQKIGNIDTSGKIGSTSGKPVITTTGGTVTTGSFGTTSGTFAEGNHTHSGYISTSSTTGLIKNDGTVMTSGTGSSNYSAGNHTHSGYATSTHSHGYILNNGTVSGIQTPSASYSFRGILGVFEELDEGYKIIPATFTTGYIKNTSALSNLGANANSTQAFINGQINTLIATKVTGTKVTSWSSTTSDDRIPSEKLVKDSLDDIEDLIGDAITYINQ